MLYEVITGSHVTLMKANYDRLIDGAYKAANSIKLDDYNGEPILSIAISCVGRRLVLKQRTRITSYNVCYTKLLRSETGLGILRAQAASLP